MAQQTQLKPSALPGSPYGSFAKIKPTFPKATGVVTRLRAHGLPGGAYGVFAKVPPEPIVLIDIILSDAQLHRVVLTDASRG